MNSTLVNLRTTVRATAGVVLAGVVLVLSAGAGEAASTHGSAHSAQSAQAAPSHVADTTW